MANKSIKTNLNFSGVIIERKDKKMLFQLRDNNPLISDPNKWWIFGGGIEPNEKPINAAVRELKEEINLKINKKDLKLIFIKKLKNKKVYFFKFNFKKNMAKLRLKEGQDMKFMSRKEILNKKNVSNVLRDFMNIYPLIPANN